MVFFAIFTKSHFLDDTTQHKIGKKNMSPAEVPENNLGAKKFLIKSLIGCIPSAGGGGGAEPPHLSEGLVLGIYRVGMYRVGSNRFGIDRHYIVDAECIGAESIGSESIGSE